MLTPTRSPTPNVKSFRYDAISNSPCALTGLAPSCRMRILQAMKLLYAVFLVVVSLLIAAVLRGPS